MRLNRRVVRNAPYNPRDIDESARQAIKGVLADPRYGHLGPLNLNMRTERRGWAKEDCGFYVLGGHQRLELTDVIEGTSDYEMDFAVNELDEVGERTMNIYLNNQAAQGFYNEQKLRDLLIDTRQLQGFKLERTGFATMDLEMMFPGDLELLGTPATTQPIALQSADAQDTVNDLAALQAEAEREKAAIKEMKAKRKEHRFNDAFKEADTGFQVMLVFDNRAQVYAFLDQFQLARDMRYLPGMVVADNLGVGEAIREAVPTIEAELRAEVTRKPAP